ncbi:hypothetical protein MASR2M18_08460 [Ignavibacteria bacterium]|nr:methyltransferase [Bacteroidota bacterium]MCZ2132199.1 methyltransferase [Bacteroidota bacterium]
MRRNIEQINKNYETSKVDQWGSDWRGVYVIWHDYCIKHILSELSGRQFSDAPLSILDIGCGSGILSEKIYIGISSKYSIKEYIGADVSASAIQKAIKLFPNTRINYTVISEAATDFPEHKFDIIIGLQFLSYLFRDERNRLISTLKSLLVQDGMAVFSSNVRTDSNEDNNYLNAENLGKDLCGHFNEIKYYDLFTAHYVDDFEAKIFKYSFFPPIRWLMKNTKLPLMAHNYYAKRTTDSYPLKRLRLYFCK